MMRALLSGMPECKLGLNDKLVLDRGDGGGGGKGGGGGGGAGGKKKPAGVELDDVQVEQWRQQVPGMRVHADLAALAGHLIARSQRQAPSPAEGVH
jgi:hypothetical protein